MYKQNWPKLWCSNKKVTRKAMTFEICSGNPISLLSPCFRHPLPCVRPPLSYFRHTFALVFDNNSIVSRYEILQRFTRKATFSAFVFIFHKCNFFFNGIVSQTNSGTPAFGALVKKNTDQIYSCPRDCRLYWNPPYITALSYWGVQGGPKLGPIMPRDYRFSASWGINWGAPWNSPYITALSFWGAQRGL